MKTFVRFLLLDRSETHLIGSVGVAVGVRVSALPVDARLVAALASVFASACW